MTQGKDDFTIANCCASGYFHRIVPKSANPWPNREEERLPRGKAPPSMWTGPTVVEAAPSSARNRELEERKEENWRIKRRKTEMMQELEHMRMKKEGERLQGK